MEEGSTVLQACESVGIEVPRFCYHERLSIAGNCRMCLVEIEKTPKPVASCAMPLMNGMKIYTDTPLVKKARESVLEFLLLNHPLDCPICDQGGECDLQDQALVFGSDRSRFYETKRSVENKNYGPLVKTIMTRCIHCTRCVRFATEIAGIEDLGCTGRGNDTEIGTYIGSTMKSELSGNVIDLCPVGALTSKPYAFTSRPWEIRSTNSIDPTDGLGSNIKIDFRGTEILRVLPRFKEEINEEWIADKIRFSYDGLGRQRILTPLGKKDGSFKKLDWETALGKTREKFHSLDPSKISLSVCGDSNLETLVTAYDFLNKIGVTNRQYGNIADTNVSDNSYSYSFNEGIQNIENVDTCLIVNTNPRHDATLLNARLRKRFLKGGFNVALVGSYNNLTFPVQQLGTSLSSLNQIAEGKHSFCKVLANSSNPRIIFCGDNLNSDELNFFKGVQHKLERFFPGSFSFLSTSCNAVGSLDLGFKTKASTQPSLQYIIDNDDSTILSKSVDTNSIWSKILPSSNSTKIYQGHHGDICADSKADYILPGASFVEERSLFVNTEGRNQKTGRVYKTRFSVRENWKILKAIGSTLLEYCSYKELNDRVAILNPGVLSLGKVSNDSTNGDLNSLYSTNYKNIYNIGYKPLASKLDNYYTTNTTTRASETMAECSSVFVQKFNFSE